MAKSKLKPQGEDEHLLWKPTEGLCGAANRRALSPCPDCRRLADAAWLILNGPQVAELRQLASRSVTSAAAK